MEKFGTCILMFQMVHHPTPLTFRKLAEIIVTKVIVLTENILGHKVGSIVVRQWYQIYFMYIQQTEK